MSLGRAVSRLDRPRSSRGGAASGARRRSAPLLLVAFAFAVGAPALAAAAARDWIGSERCGSCHPAQLSAWGATAHARPFAAAGRATAACLACHTTGESPAGPVIERVVGCEACHGAGADYAAEDIMRNRRLALDLGLADLSAAAAASAPASAPSVALSPRAAVCASCHRAVALAAGRDLATLLARPAHPPLQPKPAPGGSP